MIIVIKLVFTKYIFRASGNINSFRQTLAQINIEIVTTNSYFQSILVNSLKALSEGIIISFSYLTKSLADLLNL